MVKILYYVCTDMPDVGRLQCLHKIASEADVKIDYVALGHRCCGEAYETEADRVVDVLKSAHLYDLARAFAKAAHLCADSVTIDQVLVMF